MLLLINCVCYNYKMNQVVGYGNLNYVFCFLFFVFVFVMLNLCMFTYVWSRVTMITRVYMLAYFSISGACNILC